MYHRAAKAVCVSILGFVLSCVVSPCVYAAGPRLINFTNPHIAKSKAGADNSREQFFNPACTFAICASAFLPVRERASEYLGTVAATYRQ